MLKQLLDNYLPRPRCLWTIVNSLLGCASLKYENKLNSEMSVNST